MQARGAQATLLKVFPNIRPGQPEIPLLQHVDPLNQQPQGMWNSNLVAQSLSFLV